MKRLGYLTLLAAAALSSPSFMWAATTVTAPVPPTLVQNVNEPGLNPYFHAISVNQTSTLCDSFFCAIQFPVVPEGKRLVITYASAQFALATASSTVASVSLASNQNEGNQLLLPVPGLDGLGKYYIAASPVTFYVNPGFRPEVLLAGQYILDNGSNTAQVTLSGYYVNL
jgi:hypothetical protein